MIFDSKLRAAGGLDRDRPMNIAEAALRAVMERYGLKTQTDVEKFVGIPQSTVGRILSGGDSKVSTFELILAKAEDIPLDRLLGRGEPKVEAGQIELVEAGRLDARGTVSRFKPRPSSLPVEKLLSALELQNPAPRYDLFILTERLGDFPRGSWLVTRPQREGDPEPNRAIIQLVEGGREFAAKLQEADQGRFYLATPLAGSRFDPFPCSKEATRIVARIVGAWVSYAGPEKPNLPAGVEPD